MCVCECVSVCVCEGVREEINNTRTAMLEATLELTAALLRVDVSAVEVVVAVFVLKVAATTADRIDS